ncbi:MAG: thioredoxin family protein [Pirellulales bacterium]
MSSFRSWAVSATAVLMTLVLSSGWAFAGGKGWGNDIAAAMKQAEAEKKDLLLDFTGSDWCGWCITLNDEVFSKDAFKDDAKDHFVLVEFDFPNDKSKLSEETQKQNQEWNEKLAVKGYPTIFLADEQGRPYAQTGYQPGGAEAYVAHLTELRGKRVERDKEFAAAAEAKGQEKAQHLAAALDVVGEELALNAYADVVKELIQADANNEAGLKGKYEQKLADAEFDKAISKLAASFNGKNAGDLLAAFDEAVEKYKPSAARLSQATLSHKLQLLIAAEKHDEALALIDKLSADEQQSLMVKLQLGLAKANLLRQLKRLDEAVQAMDDLIANAPAENDLPARLGAQKGIMLVDMDRKDEAAKAFDAAIEAASNDQLKAQIRQVKERTTAASKPSDEQQPPAEQKAQE